MFGPQHDIELLKQITQEKMADDIRLERDMRAYVYFFEFLLMTGPNLPEHFTGCSFSQRGANTLLVVKRVKDDIPQVAYVTERTPTGCIVTFGRVHLEGRLKWHPDKFART
jgi:hypothetical protein